MPGLSYDQICLAAQGISELSSYLPIHIQPYHNTEAHGVGEHYYKGQREKLSVGEEV